MTVVVTVPYSDVKLLGFPFIPTPTISELRSAWQRKVLEKPVLGALVGGEGKVVRLEGIESRRRL